jgi:hypothetical protein
VHESQTAAESVESGYCMSSRDQVGDDYNWFSAESVEMSVCGVVFCAFDRGLGWDFAHVGKEGCEQGGFLCG